MASKYWFVGTQFEFPPTPTVTMKTAVWRAAADDNML